MAGRGVDYPLPHIAPMLKKEYNYTPTTPRVFHALYRVNCYLYANIHVDDREKGKKIFNRAILTRMILKAPFLPGTRYTVYTLKHFCIVATFGAERFLRKLRKIYLQAHLQSSAKRQSDLSCLSARQNGTTRLSLELF